MEDNKTLIEWIKDDVQKLTEGLDYIRTRSLPHLHQRIDRLFYIVLIISIILIGSEGIKGVIPLILKMLQ